ncbi:TonB-dependent receptor [Hephaestia caeni]|uniref:TonB-dependent receptor n=1 Tax=Hephaestia caeni TaxID=645617 RepID=A0A397PEE2_9SPHN|nr:TonB-dependent receptor [Hephaestia caeni]RIA45537.1 TonB-dependent receptor [Hephaestia caeni]
MGHGFKAMMGATICGAAFNLAIVSAAYAQSAGSITGTVSSEGGGNVLPGAVVTLEGTEYRAVTGRDGSYRLADIAPGTYTLTVSYVGFADYRDTVTIGDNGAIAKKIALRAEASDIASGRADMGEILVQGYRFGTTKSLNEQKEAANIKNVISEEMISSFPDLNTANVLSRVPGVSSDGRFVSIRGTAPQMTEVTINGEQVAFSNSSDRSVELNVVSAAQLSGIEVTKVVTPDMDATAVGGAINLKTRGAFDYNGRRIVVDAGAGRNSIADGTDLRASGFFSDVIGADDSIGLALGANFARTNTEQHIMEARWEENEDVNGNTLPYAFREATATYSKNVRDWYGVNGRIDFRPSPTTSLYASGVYNVRYDDQDRQNLRHRFDRGDYLSADAVEGARAIMGLHDRMERQLITSYMLGGEQYIGDSTIEFSLSHSKAYTKKSNGQLKPEFEARGLDYAFSDLDTRHPHWTITNGVDLTDGDIYKFDTLDLRYENTTSKIDTARLDFTKPITFGSDTGSIKIGAKYSRQHKVRADIRNQYHWAGDDDLTLTPFIASRDEYHLKNGYSVGPTTDRDAFRKFWEDNLSSFELTQRAEVSLGEPYDAKETISSVYAMTTQEYGDLLVLAGVRAEFRKLDYSATNLILETNQDTGTDGVVILNELVNSKRKYHHFFPNLQFRYRIGESTNIRAAYSKGLALPNFFDATPYSTTSVEIEDGEIDGAIVRGNPGLNPAVSHNFDLLGEHFFKRLGLLSAGIFYKKIENFTYLSRYDQPDGPYAGLEVQQYANGASAELVGAEIAWQQQFTFLPGLLSGFGIYANYTYTDAFNVNLAPDSERTSLGALPQQKKHVGNLALTYERGAILSKLALNYTGKSIDEVGANEEEDFWDDKLVTVDFSFTYKFRNHLDLYVQGNNLTNAIKYAYFGRPTRSDEYSLTGRTITIGARYTF